MVLDLVMTVGCDPKAEDQAETRLLSNEDQLNKKVDSTHCLRVAQGPFGLFSLSFAFSY